MKSEEELAAKLGMYEQHIRQIQQQFQAVEESIVELNSLDFGLDEIKNSVGKEILAPIGRGIFVKAELKSDDLTVNVGDKNFVGKSILETKKIIKEQMKRLNETREELEKRMDEIQEEAKDLIIQSQGEN